MYLEKRHVFVFGNGLLFNSNSGDLIKTMWPGSSNY